MVAVELRQRRGAGFRARLDVREPEGAVELGRLAGDEPVRGQDLQPVVVAAHESCEDVAGLLGSLLLVVGERRLVAVVAVGDEQATLDAAERLRDRVVARDPPETARHSVERRLHVRRAVGNRRRGALVDEKDRRELRPQRRAGAPGARPSAARRCARGEAPRRPSTASSSTRATRPRRVRVPPSRPGNVSSRSQTAGSVSRTSTPSSCQAPISLAASAGDSGLRRRTALYGLAVTRASRRSGVTTSWGGETTASSGPTVPGS